MIIFPEDLIMNLIYTFREIKSLPFVALYRYEFGEIGFTIVARTRTGKKYYFYSVGMDDTRYYYIWSDWQLHEIDSAKFVFHTERA